MQRYFSALLLLVLLAATACSPEKKLARNYVKTYRGNGIMIVPQYELLKDNYTISYDTAASYSPEQLDSIAWVQSVYIRSVSDSVFLTRYTNGLINQLAKYGYDVYVDGGADVFLSLPDPKWMLGIEQLQLVENYSDLYKDILTASGDIYTESVRRNQISLNTWLSAKRANAETGQTLFLETFSEDKLKNKVAIFYDQLALRAMRDSLNMEDVYKLASQSGRKHAELLFDYFMNDYIRVNMPSGRTTRELYHYNFQRNSLKHGLQQRFEVVD